MTEEQKDTQAEQIPPVEPTVEPEVKPAVEPEVEPENKDITGQEALDDDGVPYKNRAAEAQRKLEQKEEELEELRLRVQDIESRVTKPIPAVHPNPNASKEEMEKFIALGPKEYNRQIQMEEQQRQKNASAEKLIINSFGSARARYGLQKVVEYANENLINIGLDPERAVAKILEAINPKKVVPAVKPLTAEEKKKAADAIKNKPISGKQTPATPVKSDSGKIIENLQTRGTMDDAAAYLQDRFFK